jgi:hypothetical protein
VLLAGSGDGLVSGKHGISRFSDGAAGLPLSLDCPHILIGDGRVLTFRGQNIADGTDILERNFCHILTRSICYEKENKTNRNGTQEKYVGNSEFFWLTSIRNHTTFKEERVAPPATGNSGGESKK